MGQIYDFIIKHEDHYKMALGAKRDFASWFAQLKTWAMEHENDPGYSKVGKKQILAAYTAAAINGLMIDGEECMVMVRGQKAPKIKCEIGAKGVVRKAGQAGWSINARTVFDGDSIDLDEGSGYVKHTPAALVGQKRGEPIGYYAVAKRKGGIQVVRFMTVEDAEKRATNSGAWKSWFNEMGEKTVILTLRKVLYFGDEIEDMMSAAEVELGDGWAIGEAEQEAAEEPRTPPKQTRDKVMEAARKAQDEAAEASQDEDDDEFVNGDDEPAEEDDDVLI